MTTITQCDFCGKAPCDSTACVFIDLNPGNPKPMLKLHICLHCLRSTFRNILCANSRDALTNALKPATDPAYLRHDIGI